MSVSLELALSAVMLSICSEMVSIFLITHHGVEVVLTLSVIPKSARILAKAPARLVPECD